MVSAYPQVRVTDARRFLRAARRLAVQPGVTVRVFEGEIPLTPRLIVQLAHRDPARPRKPRMLDGDVIDLDGDVHLPA